ncbi:antiterminator Q family protein [Morganella morganii]|uniref:antiterminator Q family protein n=1 Tax=Morganella morganii TaxID=582 RepID=UPI000F4A427C|nr:antiterminator Q family protein [Morganella morganii]ROJ31582.1 antitermination protein [Morganella morganii]
MSNIQMILERWGAWVADNPESVTWSSIAAGFKGLIPVKVKSRQQCTDNDALVISGIMAKLNIRNSDMHDLLFDYYVFGKTFIQLAKKYGCSDTHIGKKLQKAICMICFLITMFSVRRLFSWPRNTGAQTLT